MRGRAVAGRSEVKRARDAQAGVMSAELEGRTCREFDEFSRATTKVTLYGEPADGKK